jgi:hypothetical protein
MTGRVLWLRPADRRGVVVGEDGIAYAFQVPPDELELHGGDQVEFAVHENGTAPDAISLRLKARCVDWLNDEHPALVQAFHEIVAIDS